jgi:hypothetical protein
MFKYGSFDNIPYRQTYLHGKIGNRWAYLYQKVNIDHPEQPVGTVQIGIG